MRGEIIWACAWCEEEKPEAERDRRENVTHGICLKHRAQLEAGIKAARRRNNTMKTTAELANEITDNWMEHFLGAHPEVVLQAICDRTLAKYSCRVCDSLHRQLSEIK